MDILIIFIIAAILFLIGLMAPKIWNLFSIWKRTRDLGLRLNWKEIFSLRKFYELEDWFLNACKNFKEINHQFSIVDLVHHHMADGNTIKFIAYCREAKNMELDLSSRDLVLMHLGGKDLMESNISDIVEIGFSKEVDELKVSYNCHLRIKSSSKKWINQDVASITERVQSDIESFVQKNGLDAEDNILDKLLTKSYWHKLCHGTVDTQTINISKS